MVARQIEGFQYDPSKSFRAWLKTVARGAWCDWLEKQRRPGGGSGDSQVVELLATVEAGDDLARRIEEEYERELLEAASVRVQLRVEPHTWEAFRLQVFEGLSGADTAAKLGMNVGAVYVARSKVQKMLQQEIQELEGPQP
jgi:RNA polymerase sigma-70 factor (ECF subfamily)